MWWMTWRAPVQYAVDDVGRGGTLHGPTHVVLLTSRRPTGAGCSFIAFSVEL